MVTRLALLLAFLWISIFPGAPCDDDNVRPADSITLEELRDHMFFLACDELEGRYVGSAGYETAVKYCASQLRAAGVAPMFNGADGKPAFTQAVPLARRSITSLGPLLVHRVEGEVAFEADEDVKVAFLGNVAAIGTPKPVVFAGYGISEPENGWDDLAGLDLANKIVVIFNGSPTRGGEPVLPEKLHKQYGGVQSGLQKKAQFLFSKGVAAVLIAADKQLEVFWKMIHAAVNKQGYVYIGSNDGSKGLEIPSFFIIRAKVLESMFQGRPDSPLEEGGGLKEDYRCFELQDVGISFRSQADEEECETWNVAGIVEGSDPALKDQYIVVGAHLDHIPPTASGQVNNGADDNASGSIGVLEIAEAVAMHPPRRSVVFVLYAAEEVGLYGSRHFVNDCPVPIDEVMVNINLDMIGRNDANAKETRSHYVLGADRVCPELKDVLVAVNERTVKWPLDFERYENFFTNSDHFNYHRLNIPTVFFFSGAHEDLHRPGDDAEKIDYDKMQNLCRLIYWLTMELGDRDAPLCAGTTN